MKPAAPQTNQLHFSCMLVQCCSKHGPQLYRKGVAAIRTAAEPSGFAFSHSQNILRCICVARHLCTFEAGIRLGWRPSAPAHRSVYFCWLQVYNCSCVLQTPPPPASSLTPTNKLRVKLSAACTLCVNNQQIAAAVQSPLFCHATSADGYRQANQSQAAAVHINTATKTNTILLMLALFTSDTASAPID